MGEESNSHSQVSFSILEVNGIDLVRHRGGANLTSDIFLGEIAQRNVHPHVSSEVNQDGIGMGKCETLLSDRIVRFNLGGVWVPFKPKTANKSLGNVNPVLVWEGDKVCIEVASGAIELATGSYLLEVLDLVLKSVGKVCNLFAHCRRCGTLSMGSAEHWDIREFASQCSQLLLKASHLREDDILE